MTVPRTKVRILSAGAAGVLALMGSLLSTAPAHAGTTTAPQAAQAPAAADAWAVSVGDSYVSGEAGRWAGNTRNLTPNESLIDAGGPATYFDNAAHTAESIKGCHRGTSSEIFFGAGLSGLDLACSGGNAVSVPKSSDGTFKPGVDFYSGAEGQGQALQLQQFAATHRVKMVLFGLGGNEFNFSGIITQCATAWTLGSWSSDCKNSTVAKNAMAPANVSAVTNRVATAMQNVRTAMRNAGYADGSWTLMVQNYPSPIPNGGTGPGATAVSSSSKPAIASPSMTPGLFRYVGTDWSRQYDGGCLFRDNDATWANATLLPTINQMVAAAIGQSGLTNVRTLDVSSAFNNHRLCETGVNLVGATSGPPAAAKWTDPAAADQSEWINQIRTESAGVGNLAVQESMHPNYWGQLALRNCLRQAFNNGAPVSATCVNGTGLNAAGEPTMTLKAVKATGTVTSGGSPVPGACVYLYVKPDAPSASYATCTAPDGSFEIPALTPGSYTVAVADPSGRYETSWSQAPVQVDGTSALAPSLTAKATGVVSGTVSQPSGPATACVYLYRHGEPSGAAYATCTDAGGRYSVHGVAPGSYDVAYFDPTGTYPTQWYGGATQAANQADAVATDVSGGSTTTLDARFAAAVLSVSGTVADADGPVAGACVYLYPASGSQAALAATCTGSDGRYWLGGLAAGDYKLAAADPTAAHESQWWTGSTGGARTFDRGATLPGAVGGGKLAADLTLASLATGGVAGAVTDAGSGARAGGACVYLYPTGRSDSAAYASCAADDGTYRVDGVAAGSYQVAFFDPGARLATQWWTGAAGGAEGQSAGIPVPVARTVVGGVDAALRPVG